MKEVRKQLYEDDSCLLERRDNRYYLSFYSNEGKFLREVIINLKEDGKVTIGQYK